MPQMHFFGYKLKKITGGSTDCIPHALWRDRNAQYIPLYLFHVSLKGSFGVIIYSSRALHSNLIVQRYSVSTSQWQP